MSDGGGPKLYSGVTNTKACRIYMGVHYPTDVIGGFALGTAAALLLAPLAMALLTPVVTAVARSERVGWLVRSRRPVPVKAKIRGGALGIPEPRPGSGGGGAGEGSGGVGDFPAVGRAARAEGRSPTAPTSERLREREQAPGVVLVLQTGQAVGRRAVVGVRQAERVGSM